MNKLANKVAIVTGASKGIGAAIAKALAAEGASVVVNYATSKAGADQVVDEIYKAGGKAVAVGGDVSKAAEGQSLVAAALTNYGRLDILVNNAGVYEAAGLEAITQEHYHRLFNLNVLGLLLVTQAAAAHLAPGGSIINVGSAVTRTAYPGYAVYTATKGAVDGLTGVLAKELGARKIRVNSVNPGLVVTEGMPVAGTDMEKAIAGLTPLGRVGQPGDIAAIATFLASDDSGWITGERIVASGGH